MGIANQRGMLLYNQKRYAMAADEFRKELTQNPNSAWAMGMLALSLNFDHKPKEAMAAARAAVATNPERGFVHYVLACVMIGTKPDSIPLFRVWSFIFRYRSRLRKARGPAMEAIRLNPRNAGFIALISGIELDLRRPKKSLEWAERGLAIQADHVECTNLRARALANLGRASEGTRQTLQGSLAINPENASTHSHGGWTHLKVGDPVQAEAHFRESVRLNPVDPSAQQGLRLAHARANLRGKYSIAISFYLLYLGVLMIRAAYSSDPSDQSLSFTIELLCIMTVLGVALAVLKRYRL